MDLSTARSEDASDQTARELSGVSPMRAAIAGGLGSLIEYFDFAIYGFVAVYIAAHFFPSDQPAVGVLATMGAFTLGYIVRPLGGWYFGRMGDKRGRSRALVMTVIFMGVFTAAIGILPDYATIGIWAPIALLALRVGQGFCAGGEAAGAASYAAECAPPLRRGFYVSFTPTGTTAGFALAAVTVGLTTLFTSTAAMQSWGWRIPFLVVAPITLVCTYFRLKLEDSPEFVEMLTHHQVVKSPIKQVLIQYPKRVLMVALLNVATYGTSTMILTYFPTFFIKGRGFEAQSFYWMMSIVILTAMLSFPFIGMLGDRFGRKKVMLFGYGALALMAYPLFYWFENATSLVVIGIVFLLYYFIAGCTITSTWLVAVELMPRAVRYTGSALGINIGGIGIGFGPTIAAQVVNQSGGNLLPVAWIPIVCGVVGAATLLIGVHETAGVELEK